MQEFTTTLSDWHNRMNSSDFGEVGQVLITLSAVQKPSRKIPSHPNSHTHGMLLAWPLSMGFY